MPCWRRRVRCKWQRRSRCRRRGRRCCPTLAPARATTTTSTVRRRPDFPLASSNYSVYGGGLDLTVPVYRPQNWTALDQAKLTVVQSEAQLAQSQQDLALRVAIAYFNVLAARDQLIALVASKQATGEQLQQARREFEVGTKTIIDTNEAQARFDQIAAQEQVALGALLVRRSELQVIIAREPDTLAPLRERPNLNPPLPQDINAWVRAAEIGNYSVQIAASGYEIATREIQRQRDAYKPTVDLVSGYNINKFNGTQGHAIRIRASTADRSALF